MIAFAQGTVTVRQQPLVAQYTAYAEVRPIALVPVRAAQPGTVTDMRILPGSRVEAGEPLARLSGPEIQALLIARQGTVRSARTRYRASRQALEAERRQLAVRLTTRQSVAAAESAVTAAATALQTARAQLRVAQKIVTLRAPAAGTVIAVNAGSGERVLAGETVLTLQGSGALWLEATYYGQNAASIQVGMQGRFEPASGGSAVAVKVASVFASLAPGGGEEVGLLATVPTDPWVNGEWGTVMIAGPARRLVAVPTRALIIDGARWWVLVRTSKGDRAQPVTPGPARGWDTFIESGLVPGERVVVQNAYLEFHRGISRLYTPPD